LREYKASVV